MKILSIILVALSLISCTKRESKEKNNTLNYALTSKISTVDPAVSYDTVSGKVIAQVYESLYEYDYLVRPYQLKPLLAKDLPVVDNTGLKYTIKIKENIAYHPHEVFKGKKRFVTAQDFINQFKRVAFKPTKSNGWWLFDGKIKGINDFREKAKADLSNFFELSIEGLKALNDHTLEIHLTQPFPQFKYALAMAFTTPVTKEIIEWSKNDLSNHMIGTGPYLFKEWIKNSSFTLSRNPDYHENYYPDKGDRIANDKKLLADSGKRIPFINEVKFHIMEQAQTRWLNFLQKNIDLIVLTKDHFPLALNNKGKINKEFTDMGIQLQIAPTLTYWWLAFNMKDPLLGKNLHLRKAIAHAININQYIESFTNNIGLKANSIYPPGVKGYNPSHIPPYKYDLKLAKEYLKKAGFPEGKNLPEFSYDVRGSSTVSRQMGEYIQKELAKANIKVRLNLNSFPGFLQKVRTGQLQMWQGGWAMDYPDPENVVQLLITKNHSPGPNSTYYTNSKVDKLYSQLFEKTDHQSVVDITTQVEKEIAKDLPWIMQFYARNYILHHKRLKNFRQSDLISNNIKYLRLD